MILALGASSQYERSSIMLKVLSWVIILIEIISNVIFAFCDFSTPVYNHQWANTSDFCSDI